MHSVTRLIVVLAALQLVGCSNSTTSNSLSQQPINSLNAGRQAVVHAAMKEQMEIRKAIADDMEAGINVTAIDAKYAARLTKFQATAKLIGPLSQDDWKSLSSFIPEDNVLNERLAGAMAKAGGMPKLPEFE